jgi:phage protein D
LGAPDCDRRRRQGGPGIDVGEAIGANLCEAAGDLLNPILIGLQVHDAAGTASDTAEIDIDDTNGRVVFPRDGAYMATDLGWRSSGIARVFEGTVDDVKSRGARGEGRTLHIPAKSADTRAKTKQHWEKKTLGDVMQDTASLAGLTMTVDPPLGPFSATGGA